MSDEVDTLPPRERLLAHGAEVLSDAELISILIRTGTNGTSALDLGRELLDRMQGIAGLVGKGADEWIAEPGIGPAKTAAFLAAVELARRIARANIPNRLPMERPDTVARYLALRYGTPDQEVMGVLHLDTRHRLIREAPIYRGTINRAAADPRSILKAALLQSAAGIILFHTHPSGDPSPSAEDIAFTRRMAEAGDVVGIRLIDHLVLGSPGRWVSLKQRGAW